MADRQEPRDAAGSGESLPGRGEDVDQDRESGTAAVEGVGQDRESSPAAVEGERLAGEAGSPGGEQPLRRPVPDDTAPFSPTEGTAAEPADETATNRQVVETAPLATLEQAAPLSLTPPPWSGRAQVPRLETTVRDAAPQEWYEGDGRAPGRWWMPIVVGILALLLLGILAYGVWLIVQSRDRSASPAAPPTAAPPTATSTSATPRQTSSAPTTGPPTPTATTAAATVPVPQLVGLSEAAARAALERIGLTARVQFRPSDRTPGTVIDTSPRPGASVPVGSQVTLVIAQAPTTAPPSSPAPTATATPTG